MRYRFRAPQVLAQINSAIATEADAFLFEQDALYFDGTRFATGADGACGVNYPLPGNGGGLRQSRQHHPYLSGGSGAASIGRNLSIGGNVA